ncbi:MAG: hypothetical protein ABSA92_04855 [Candidatus Bathyarchaeia archaeon]|jgi:hypothetical protein
MLVGVSGVWEFGDRGWVSITVGIAAGGVAGQGASGKDNEHKGLAGWNFAGLDWYFVLGLIFGFDFVVDKFGLYAAPLIMIGSNSIVPGIGLGIALFRRVGLGVIIPFWMFGVIVPTIFATIASAAIGVILLIGVVVAILFIVRRAKRRIE